MIPKAVKVRVSPEERAVLEARLRASTTEQRQVFRARPARVAGLALLKAPAHRRFAIADFVIPFHLGHIASIISWDMAGSAVLAAAEFVTIYHGYAIFSIQKWIDMTISARTRCSTEFRSRSGVGVPESAVGRRGQEAFKGLI